MNTSCVGRFSAVVGGRGSVATGSSATVAGGSYNRALGVDSLVAGAQATASHNAAAVLAFSDPVVPCESKGPGTVTICSSGGLFVDDKLVSGIDTSNIVSGVYVPCLADRQTHT